MRHRLYFSYIFIPDLLPFTSILFLPLSLLPVLHILPSPLLLWWTVSMLRIHCPSRLPPPLHACARRGEIKAFPSPRIPTKTYYIRFPCWCILSFFFFFSPSFPTLTDPCLPTSSSGEIFSLLRRSILSNKKALHFLSSYLFFRHNYCFHLFTFSSYPSSTLFFPDPPAVTH